MQHVEKNLSNQIDGQAMSTPHTTAPNAEELNQSLSKAMNQVNARKETDLCLYLPKNGARLHHLAFAKMKKTQPYELLKLIKENILEKEAPMAFSFKRKPVRMLKKQFEVKFKKSQINQGLLIKKT